MSRPWWWFPSIGLFIVLLVYILYNAFYVAENLSEVDSHSSVDRQCNWKTGDPVVYNLKTKMGVNYDAGHWFHMSENFMTQHSILREKHSLTNASIVYYNFDKAGFIDNLNGITRLMVYLGTISPLSHTQKLNYVYMVDGKHHLPAVNGATVQIEQSMITNEQSVDLSPAIQPAGRFAKSQLTGSAVLNSNKETAGPVCAKFMGSIGGLWPTPQRGHWFPNEGDIDSFRQKIRDACPPDADMIASTAKTRRFKIVIYQRDLSRRLANEQSAISMLRETLSDRDWEIQVVMHVNKRSPCELAHLLRNADMLITPHGFQSMLLMFLPRPAVIFEVFPYRYFKRGYGPFGGEYGVIHGGTMSPGTLWHTKFLLSFVTTDWCMVTKSCRTYARDQDVLLTRNGVNKVVEVIRSHPELFGTNEQTKAVSSRDFLY